ncbi:MAG: LysM peptidoglycan-binding domain-containing protein [Thermodesulfovibrionales bacterium]|jgi:cell wall-associated NlpC family hydrolase
MRRIVCFFVISFFILISNPSGSQADTTYTLKKGDTLYRISKTFRVSLEKIKEANNMTSDNLKPGVKITIPSKQSTAKRSARSSHTPSSGSVIEKNHDAQKDDQSQNVQYHIVRRGDTLMSVAKEYSIPVEELRELNNINHSKRLKIGRQLVVKRAGPKTYTVKKGDNIGKVAKRFSITPDEIMDLNELDSENLKQGQHLLLEDRDEPADTKAPAATLPEASVSDSIAAAAASTELNSLGMKERLILFAKKMLNIPYRFGGSSFIGIDCSGYVQKVYSFLNFPLPRTAREQFSIGEPVSKEDLSIGDLVFFRTYASFPSHVGIYLGNDLFIHASSRGRKVTIDSLETPYYFKRFIGAKRLLFDQANEKEEDLKNVPLMINQKPELE